MDLDNLSKLQTESVNPRTVDIDRMSTREMCTVINAEDGMIAESLAPWIPLIAGAIDALAPRVRHGGRVIYVGAGTSGRLGILDASEIPPTFAAPFSQFIGMIAGGDAAIRRAQEGAEDSAEAGEADLSALKLDPKVDSVIGIAASGRTPYVLSCLSSAKRAGALTIGVACVAPSAMSQSGNVDYLITPLPGPEVVTGSTRLKAGTATKMVLNMLSTGTMIRIGKTYGNMMVDLVASNLKLEQRSRNILRKLSKNCEFMSKTELDFLLLKCNGSVKLALLAAETGLPMEDCRATLDQTGGVLAKALEARVANFPTNEYPVQERKYVLCIDGGGTKCAAVIADHTGVISRGVAGPCNLTDGASIDQIVGTLFAVTQSALADGLGGELHRSYVPLQEYIQRCFKSVWIGLAGIDRSGFHEKLGPKVSELFGLSIPDSIHLTNDVDLLSACISTHHTGPLSAIVAIAGTGSVAMRYTRIKGRYVRVARSGGWGHILGDEGSGYSIGLQAIQHTLANLEERRLGILGTALGNLEKAVTSHLGCTNTDDRNIDILSELLIPHGAQSCKSRIAGVARVVLDLAKEDEAAAAIIDAQAHSFVSHTLQRLVNSKSESYTPPADSGLILSGSVMNNSTYRNSLLTKLASMGIQFRFVETVSDAALAGANFLRRDIAS